MLISFGEINDEGGSIDPQKKAGIDGIMSQHVLRTFTLSN